MIQNRLDLRLFIGYDIDELVPDHSTICKTRKRIPQQIFEEVLNYILGLCIDSGLVTGHTQSVDSAYINANASLDRMEEIKLAERDPQEYLNDIRMQDLPPDVTPKDMVARAKKNERDLTRFKEQRQKTTCLPQVGIPSRMEAKSTRKINVDSLVMRHTVARLIRTLEWQRSQVSQGCCAILAP